MAAEDSTFNVAFVVYDATGRVLRSGTVPETDIEHQAGLPGETVMVVEQSVDPATSWVDLTDNTVKPKTALPPFDTLEIVADDVDVAITTGLPNPTTITIYGNNDLATIHDQYIITDGVAEFATPIPGQYRVEVRSDDPRYLPYDCTITAVAA